MQQNQPSVRHSVEKKIRFWIHVYPSFFSILQWTILSIFLGLLIGSASAGFLQSLNWTTDFRETHLWVIVFYQFAVLALVYFIIITEKK